jgi:hypothetical protein
MSHVPCVAGTLRSTPCSTIIAQRIYQRGARFQAALHGDRSTSTAYVVPDAERSAHERHAGAQG